MARCVICDKSYEPGREMTCSHECHEELVDSLLAEESLPVTLKEWLDWEETDDPFTWPRRRTDSEGQT